jgi:DNA-binding CsgD family transcriptional regulator
MNARIPISHTDMDREMAAMIAEVLAVPEIRQAREVVMRYYAKWFHLAQILWVAEPRHFDVSKIDMSLLLNFFGPLDKNVIEAGIVLRPHNVVLQAVLAEPRRNPTAPMDVISKRDWEFNPFRAEVTQPLGLKHMLSFQIDEGTTDGDAAFMPVLSRDRREFTDEERAWLASTRTVLEPIFAYIRQREKLQTLSVGAKRGADDVLTPAEQEVFHWICQGKRNKEIAVILGRSHRTVEKHVQSILAKTGAETRTAAARMR